MFGKILIVEPFFSKEKKIEIKVIGYSLLVLWSLVGIFILYKMIVNLYLPKKIQKLSQKLAQIDKEIAKDLSRL